LYVEYGKLFSKHRSIFAYVATAVLSLAVLYSSLSVDRHLQEVTDLPAEFFPTSQTALVFLVTPVFLSMAFYVLSLVLYLLITFTVVFPMQINGPITVSRLIYVSTLFITFMFLTAGILKVNSDFFGDEYNEIYYQTFIKYSYNLNEGVCKNIDDDLYISHLRTGGVSVTYKDQSEYYCFSVERCDRIAEYSDEKKIHKGDGCR
jgi:hypothetical protein